MHHSSQSIAVSVPEAATRAGVGVATMFRVLRRGELPRVRIGRRTLVRIADLESWIGEKAANARSTA